MRFGGAAALAVGRAQLARGERVEQPFQVIHGFLEELGDRTKPSIGQIFISDDAVYYPATDTGEAHGYVTRVTAK